MQGQDKRRDAGKERYWRKVIVEGGTPISFHRSCGLADMDSLRAI